MQPWVLRIYIIIFKPIEIEEYYVIKLGKIEKNNILKSGKI